MDCPYGIFFYPRARLKGFVVHLLKEQQRRRENARSLFSRSNRSEVLLLLLFSSLVKSLLLLISHFFPTHNKKQQKKNPKNDNALGSHRATAEGKPNYVGDVKHEICGGHHLGWRRRFAFVPVDEDSFEASRAYRRRVSFDRRADVQLHQLWDQ